jgi:hypothetical protein
VERCFQAAVNTLGIGDYIFLHFNYNFDYKLNDLIDKVKGGEVGEPRAQMLRNQSYEAVNRILPHSL